MAFKMNMKSYGAGKSPIEMRSPARHDMTGSKTIGTGVNKKKVRVPLEHTHPENEKKGDRIKLKNPDMSTSYMISDKADVKESSETRENKSKNS